MAPAQIYRNTVYKKQWQYYHIAVNSSSTLSFQVNQTVSTQDCDLYVQVNSYPTQYNYFDRDISTSASFQITIDPAAVGIWYAGVYGFSDCSYAIEAITALPCPNGCSGHGACNRGVCTCNATWTGLDCATSIAALSANTALTGQSVGATTWNYYYFNHQTSGTMVFWVNQSSSSQDCDLYINRGTVPTFSSWLYREDSVAQTFSLTIPSASSGYWYAGVYGFTSCTYSIQVNTNTPCTSQCSNHGTCNSNTGACSCNRGFNGTYCQQTSLPANPASTYNGYAAQSLWNYYYVSVNAEDNLIAVVRSYTAAGSCWIYARHNALPTQISYDAASVGNTATNNSLTISQPQGGTWWIGVYGASDCNYTLTGYLSSACPNSCSGHGTCASGTCFCNSGYAGADCSLSLSPLTSNRAVSGSVGMAVWNFYTVSNVLTAFTVHLLETNTVGDIWLFVGQSDLSLTNYEYSSIDSRSANHNIIVPRLSSSAPTSYVIGVYGDPYLCASCTAAYQIVAYLTPW